MYRSALVALKPGNPNEAVGRYVVEMAARHQLKLTAMAVVDERRIAPSEPVPLGASAFKVHRDEVRLEEERKQADEALETFRTRCQAAGLDCAICHTRGALAREIARAALSADLLFLGHTVGTDAASDGADSPMHAMLKHCPRPAIVVPRLPVHGDNVLIAYDDSVQAARAVHDFALSGWWDKSTIHVVALGDDPSEAATVADRAVSFLKLHQLTAERHVVEARHEIARHLLDAAREVKAGLMVMGAYGQPTWREFVFGSVTREVLQAIEIPVFLSH